MAKSISIDELQTAVEKSVARIRLGPGPILIGFIGPENISIEDAHEIAQEVAKLTGIAGTPTVTTVGETVQANTAAAKEAKFVPPHRVIIGLIAQER